ncbi:acid phosphatase [Streptomyces sp. NA04227]|uniref:HAD family acid phosphatase n=1 Tax=Streptomyces sp. NA04227 TaxID=2742136 RepID=UPI001591EBB8|nr:HAD family acid phosphatase [Streptomyces sp. NA04227]QKW08748.1 acid phosphatase [Streptomyces sp. NA04227]
MHKQFSKYVRRGIGVTALAGAATLFAANSAFALPSEDEWKQDVAEAVAPAHSYLEERLPADGAAIVLDIDNTSLATDYDEGAPIEATLELARFAKDKGASIRFVTNRKESGRESTLRDLRNAGFPVDGLCMRQSGDDSSKDEMKTNCRIGIEDEGLTIVANIGNRDTDLIGGHAERTFKLPDYDGELQ